MDVVHLRRAGKYWYEIFCIVVDGADIFSIRITNQRTFCIGKLNLAVFCGLLIRCEQGAFCSCLDSHI